MQYQTDTVVENWILRMEIQKQALSLVSKIAIISFTHQSLLRKKEIPRLGVSPILVSSYCEGYSFWSIWGPYWDSQQGKVRTTSILVRAFWNFKLKVLKYWRNCSFHNTLISWRIKDPVSHTHTHGGTGGVKVVDWNKH